MKIRVLVRTSKPAARVLADDDEFVVELKSRPIDNAANAELVQILAEHFGVPKTRVKIVRGATSRHKTIEIV